MFPRTEKSAPAVPRNGIAPCTETFVFRPVNWAGLSWARSLVMSTTSGWLFFRITSCCCTPSRNTWLGRGLTWTVSRVTLARNASSFRSGSVTVAPPSTNPSKGGAAGRSSLRPSITRSCTESMLMRENSHRGFARSIPFQAPLAVRLHCRFPDIAARAHGHLGPFGFGREGKIANGFPIHRDALPGEIGGRGRELEISVGDPRRFRAAARPAEPSTGGESLGDMLDPRRRHVLRSHVEAYLARFQIVLRMPVIPAESQLGRSVVGDPVGDVQLSGPVARVGAHAVDLLAKRRRLAGYRASVPLPACGASPPGARWPSRSP